ncbi:MAG: phosphate signaling complex protein PhoU [Caldilineaceae bacterium]|nr:phosphate signaling complex protein PhoU [Caldilineaceae bacterium]
MLRHQFRQTLDELRDQIITMGSHVREQLRLALLALETLDTDMAKQVSAHDREVNRLRFEIEERCFVLIATEAPAARDLRLIFAAANMIVDLERMGDQAKGLAKATRKLKKDPTIVRPAELQQMGALVGAMLDDALHAYADGNLELSRQISARDVEVDALFSKVFRQITLMLAEAGDPDRVRIIYNLLRAAREIERFGDLVSNFSERSIYLITGEMPYEARKQPTPPPLSS